MNQEISTVCKQTDNVLWNAFGRGNQKACLPHLFFPQYRSKGLRVSEQEARFAFVEALSKNSLLYSVEAPTSKTYRFSGKSNKQQSAQTDLALYNFKGAYICRVEFKSQGYTTKRKDTFDIDKDIQKLLREPVWGLWFHLLRSVDNSTLNGLFNVMNSKILKVRKNFKDIETEGLTIHVCVLKHGFSLQKDIPLDGTTDLSVHLNVSRSELRSIDNLNGWTLNKRPGFASSDLKT